MLILQDATEPTIDATTATATVAPRVHCRNIGRGPALNVRFFRCYGNWVFFSESSIALAPSEETQCDPREIVMGGLEPFVELGGRRGPGHVVPPEIVSNTPQNDLAAYCVDQLGNRLRFNLRTSDPPRPSRPGESAAPWLAAWDY